MLAIMCGILCGDDHLIADTPLLKVFSEPGLGFTVLVVVGGVDEVAPARDVFVEELE